MNRSEFLSPLVGQPWSWRLRNCWEFAVHVQRELFGRSLPSVAVPEDPQWRWMIGAIAAHSERGNWVAVPAGAHGLVTAADGALCLMGRHGGPGHIGVWLAPEARVIHCDRKNGVCLESALALQQQGWRELTFFEPKENL